jgi:hypothetical protein
MQRHYVGSTAVEVGEDVLEVATLLLRLARCLRKLGIFKESGTSSQVIGF